MTDYLIDTDVFVDQLRGARRLADWHGAAYSVLTRAELYAGRSAKEATIDRLLELFAELPFDRGLAQESGRIRRVSGVSLIDAMIAATALGSGRTLITRNTKDYARIRGLSLLDPAKP